MDPAHDLTFFCFFLPVFLDAEGCRVRGCSVDSMGGLGLVCRGDEGSAVIDRGSFDDPELVGRVWGVESSWPKKFHFLDADLGVEGVADVAGDGRSVSNGLELCLRGLRQSVVENSSGLKSNRAAAVLGRVSVVLLLGGGLCCFSLGGLGAEREEKLPVAECPALTVVPDDSLDTMESGRGMTSISSAKRSCR
jgi:hypothetical protein